MQKFWMVYRLSSTYTTLKHPTHESASKECERLAEANPGFTFVVLECMGYARVDKTERLYKLI